VNWYTINNGGLHQRFKSVWENLRQGPAQKPMSLLKYLMSIKFSSISEVREKYQLADAQHTSKKWGRPPERQGHKQRAIIAERQF
jgi:hypothetical protein